VRDCCIEPKGHMVHTIEKESYPEGQKVNGNIAIRIKFACQIIAHDSSNGSFLDIAGDV
jgi:hypothetical protein